MRAGSADAAVAALAGRRLTPATTREAGEIAFAGVATTAHNAFKTELGARTAAEALMIARSRS